jgi:XTP/dITP diphosphohydrolase
MGSPVEAMLVATRPVQAMLVATRNEGKLEELRPMLAAAGFRAVSLDEAGIELSDHEESLEAFETFEENALAKARWFRAKGVALALPVLGDDSGLIVEALGGLPGVRSKRWSGSALHGQALDDENNRTLLRALEGQANRRARYVCVAAIVSSMGEVLGRGESAGTIVGTPSGNHGFGYDPYFRSDELAKTYGDATREEKSAVSHRARAVRAVLHDYVTRHR